MKTIEEMNQKSDLLADDLLKEAGRSISIENARLLIRLVYKHGYKDAISKGEVLTEDKG